MKIVIAAKSNFHLKFCFGFHRIYPKELKGFLMQLTYVVKPLHTKLYITTLTLFQDFKCLNFKYDFF
jgi:hypothetical protein